MMIAVRIMKVKSIVEDTLDSVSLYSIISTEVDCARK